MTDLPLSFAARSPWSAARIARVCTIIYVLLILLGIIIFKSPGAMIRGNEMSFERAVFTVVNAATLTGFQQAVAVDEYGTSGIVCIFVLTVAGTLFTLIIGGLALRRALRLEYSDGQIVWSTLFTFLFCVGIGTALLLESTTRGLLDSAFQAASAFGNSGLVLGHLPGVNDWRTHMPILPLAVAGGLGVPVLMELVDLIFRRRKLSKHSQVVLALSAGAYLFGLVVLMRWVFWNNSDLATASAGSIDARTAGLPMIAPMALPRTKQWILILLMTLGAAPAGAAGGIKLTALFHAFRGTRQALRGERIARVTGIAATWMISYFAILFLTILALLANLPEMAADRLVFLAASALSNCGLAFEPVVLTGGGLWTVVLAMLIGRAAPLLVIWWLAETTNDVDVAV